MRLDPVQENASQQRIIDVVSELMDIESRARHWNNNGINELIDIRSRVLHWNNNGISELMNMQSRAQARNYDGISQLMDMLSRALERTHYDGNQELMDIQSRALNVHRNHDSITELKEFNENEDEDTVSELTMTQGTVNIENRRSIGSCRVFI